MTGGVGFVIEGVWAFVMVHDDGDEALLGLQHGDTWVPLIAADETRLQMVWPYARKMAAATGKPVKLVRFHNRTDIETIAPPSREERRARQRSEKRRP